MISFSPRLMTRRLLYGLLWSRKKILDANDLSRDAIVFAPHPDDETLGCGGTIIKKKATGAAVKIVFMTDGRLSHAQHIDENRLRDIREREAILAAAKLGLPASDVIFLGFPDQELSNYTQPAVQRVQSILDDVEPEEIFIPHHKEYPKDHRATNEIVRIALEQSGFCPTVYEYAVWLWHHWPWIGIPFRWERNTFRLFRNTVYAGWGFRIVHDFRYAVFTGDVTKQKREALEQHRTQMVPLIPDINWSTLDSVSGGEYLERFFLEYELFYRSE